LRNYFRSIVYLSIGRNVGLGGSAVNLYLSKDRDLTKPLKRLYHLSIDRQRTFHEC
jgi:hypothetical protein